jgi:hypothetical protein
MVECDLCERPLGEGWCSRCSAERVEIERERQGIWATIGVEMFDVIWQRWFNWSFGWNYEQGLFEIYVGPMWLRWQWD